MPDGPRSSELPVCNIFDTSSILPPNGLEEVVRIASSMAVTHELIPGSVTSREVGLTPIPNSSLNGDVVAQELPWLRLMYLGAFRDLVQSTIESEPIRPAKNKRSGIVVDVQRSDNKMGYECHVDTVPVSALLYATSQPKGAGGELVVANRGDVSSREEVDADASKFYPVEGQLIVFDGRQHTHYVRPLIDPNDVRVAVVMNYYTRRVSEDDRPDDLDEHLFFTNT